MRRIDKKNYGNCDPYHEEDVQRLKSKIDELRHLSDQKVEELYSEFSEDCFCAGWLIMDDNYIFHFKNWLDQEVD